MQSLEALVANWSNDVRGRNARIAPQVRTRRRTRRRADACRRGASQAPCSTGSVAQVGKVDMISWSLPRRRRDRQQRAERRELKSAGTPARKPHPCPEWTGSGLTSGGILPGSPTCLPATRELGRTPSRADRPVKLNLLDVAGPLAPQRSSGFPLRGPAAWTA